MKKIFFLFMVLGSFVSIFADEFPLCEKPNSVVLKTENLEKKFEDNIVVQNFTEEKDLKFFLYDFDDEKKEWSFLGFVNLKDYSDSCKIEPLKNVKKIKYLALSSEKANNFEFKISAMHNDLYISVLKEKKFENLENVTVIEPNCVKGRFTDNIRFENYSEDFNIYFYVFACNDLQDEKKYLGIVNLKNFNDSDFLESPVKNLSKFNYYFVQSKNGKKYNFEISKKHNDLYIFVK